MLHLIRVWTAMDRVRLNSASLAMISKKLNEPVRDAYALEREREGVPNLWGSLQAEPTFVCVCMEHL